MIFFFSLTVPSSALGGFESGDKIKQVGAFHKRANALTLSEEIRKSGKQSFIIEKTVKGTKFYAVMESTQNLDDIGLAPGYSQVGAFLDRQNAETMIISLRQQGAITSHCMKEQGGKIYYMVYKKNRVRGFIAVHSHCFHSYHGFKRTGQYPLKRNRPPCNWHG